MHKQGDSMKLDSSGSHHTATQLHDATERMVWAVSRGGRLLREAQDRSTGGRPKKASDDRNLFLTTIEAHGLKRDMAYRQRPRRELRYLANG